jgi:hypothetical protein
MYCPQCGVEFVESVKTCSDCGIDLKPEPPTEPEAAFVEWVTILAHRDHGRVGLAESILQASGIEYVSEGDNTRWTELNEPVRLCVHPEDAKRAEEALKELPGRD